MEDCDIIALFEARDERAIRESAEKYGRYCHSLAYRIVCDARDAEECVSDTWLHAWDSIPPQKPSSLKLYLAKLVRNVALNRYQEKKRQKRGGNLVLEPLEELAEVVSGTSDIDTEFRRLALKDAMDRFLRGLSQEDRGIFLRRYFFAESHEEIAKRFHVKETAVRVKLSRTRQKLKVFLEKEGLL